MSKDIYKTIINKPWGNEYCIYRNNNLSIWLLKIDPSKKTSLHCHPTKKTGLILLGGLASISLIERTFNLDGFKKLIFRNGMFHQTHNISNEPIYLIEIETPDNKFDLIRIEDDYGRKHTKFEGENNWDEISENPFVISDTNVSSFKEFSFEITTLNSVKERLLKDDDLIVILENSGFSNKDKQSLCDCGEVLTFKIFKFLSERFDVNANIKTLIIWKK
jgi:mannose-6-phosphate isomerase-like protein (cupin superfamily)